MPDRRPFRCRWAPEAVSVREPGEARAPGRARSRRRASASAATSSRAPVGARPMSSQWSMSVPASRARRRISRTTALMPVRSQSTRFMLTWAIGGSPGSRAGRPWPAPRASRRSSRGWCVAMRMARARSSVRRFTLKAISGLRAPTATAPPRGWSRAGPKSGTRSGLVPISSRRPSYCPRRTCGQPPSLRTERRVAVEVHRQLEAHRDLLAEAAGQVDALLDPRAAERHERDDVDGADARVRAGVLLHVDQLQRAADRRGRSAHDRLGTAGEGHDAAVVRLIARVVEHRDAIDLADGSDDLLDDLRAPPFAEVRHALDQAWHASIVALLRSDRG